MPAQDLGDESAFAVKWVVRQYLHPEDAVILVHVLLPSVLSGADWGSVDPYIVDAAAKSPIGSSRMTSTPSSPTKRLSRSFIEGGEDNQFYLEQDTVIKNNKMAAAPAPEPIRGGLLREKPLTNSDLINLEVPTAVAQQIVFEHGHSQILTFLTPFQNFQFACLVVASQRNNGRVFLRHFLWQDCMMRNHWGLGTHIGFFGSNLPNAFYLN
ncbi:adenine nucleotide alpha hydrolases-likesuperfamily protein [Striga asiatica]|uniref:Adenine nucleotide alpha hydrolases-likesuperfamily protein n=1 Tax=Striga asiatica TaxID=4170 RepID=A0A5A7RKL7_STRAF|nr:adenine nucleotide alpha hydrolases-likesuperfamily protein [Striga asiatica]